MGMLGWRTRKEAQMTRTILSFVLFAILGFGLRSWAESPKKPTASAPSAQTVKSATLPTPLPAEMFQGKAREAYQAAAEIPEVFATVSCYCGCAKSHGHKNLLDCFVDDHGAG